MTRSTAPARALFVYGTLRPGGHYWTSIEPYVAQYDPALLTGYELWQLDDGLPAIVPGHDGVFGDLLYLRLGREERFFRLTDEIEESSPQDPASLFVRVETSVARLKRPDGPPIPAQTYVFNPAHRPYLLAHGHRSRRPEWTAGENSQTDVEDGA